MSLDLLRRFGAPRAMWNTAESGGGGAAPTGAAAAAGGAAAGASGAGADPAPAASGQPWYAAHNLDPATIAWIEERKFPDLASTLKSGMDGSRLAGSRNVLPKPDQDPVKRADWEGWEALGWTPDKAKYQVPEIPSKRGGEVLPGLREALVNAAHEARVPLDQAKALYAVAVQHMDGYLDQVQAAGAKDRLDTEESLRAKWGAEYTKREELARRAAATFGVKSEVLQAMKTGLGDSAAVVEMFARIGEKLGEATLVGVGDGGGAGAMPTTLTGLQQELNRLHGDEAWMKIFKDQRHPQHKDYVAHRQSIINRMASLQG